MAIGEAVASGIAVLYGCLLLSFACGYALFQKETWLGPSRAESDHLAAVSRQLWALDDVDDQLLEHDFLALSNGLQLHCLKTRAKLRQAAARHLVIFLHGFPDSCHLFRRVLESDLAKHAQLVSIDLPGCGGSDSLDVYSADLVLNAIVEALVLLRRRYLTHQGMKCILVGHDWGGVVGYRIAVDTRDLVDTMITMNSVYAACVEAEIRRRFSRVGHAWSSWWTLPFHVIAVELGPVWSQLRKSHYTFLLQLSFPWVKAMPQVASALLRYVHRSGSHKSTPDVSDLLLATSLSASYGPGAAELPSSQANDSPTYGETVRHRSRTSPPGDWNQRFRLYREGLILDPWTVAQSYSSHAAKNARGVITMSGQNAAAEEGWLLKVPLEQRFKCPMIVLFGIDDEALDHRLAVDPLVNYFMRPEDGPEYRESSIKKIQNCGHWSPMTEVGHQALLHELNQLVAA